MKVKMKTFEKYIQKYLTKLGYKQVSKCKNDLVNTLKVYKCLGMALHFLQKQQIITIHALNVKMQIVSSRNGKLVEFILW